MRDTKKNKIAYPFRLKLIFANLAFVAVFIVSFISLSYNSLKEDKENYLFDEIYNFSKEVSLAVQSEYYIYSNFSKLILASHKALSNKGLESLAKSVPNIKSLTIFQNGKSNKVLKNYGKQQLQYKQCFNENFRLTIQDYFYCYCDSISSECINLSMLPDSSSIKTNDEFKKFPFVLMDSENNLLFRQVPHGTNFESFVKTIRSIKKSDKVFEVLKSSEQTDYPYYSVYKIPETKLSLVVFSHQQSLTEGFNDIIVRSLLFGLILFGFAMIASVFVARFFTTPLYQIMDSIKLVGEGSYDVHVKVDTKDEFSILAGTLNVMIDSIKRYITELKDMYRLENELKLASIIQESYIPEKAVHFKGINVTGYYHPASECGGDIWGARIINDKMIIFIGDVTGHGVSAGLITSATNSVFNIIEYMGQSIAGFSPDPVEVVKLVNQGILNKGSNLNMTFFVGVIDPKTKVMEFCNASHEQPYLLREGSGEAIPLLAMPISRLGVKADIEVRKEIVQLKQNDKLILYTDGLVENKNSSGVSLDERGLYRFLCKNMSEVSIQTLVSNYEELIKGAAVDDDVTLVVLDV